MSRADQVGGITWGQHGGTSELGSLVRWQAGWFAGTPGYVTVADDAGEGWKCRKACLSLLRSVYSSSDFWILSSKIPQLDWYFRKMTLAAPWKMDWRSVRAEVVRTVRQVL